MNYNAPLPHDLDKFKNKWNDPQPLFDFWEDFLRSHSLPSDDRTDQGHVFDGEIEVHEPPSASGTVYSATVPSSRSIPPISMPSHPSAHIANLPAVPFPITGRALSEMPSPESPPLEVMFDLPVPNKRSADEIPEVNPRPAKRARPSTKVPEEPAAAHADTQRIVTRSSSANQVTSQASSSRPSRTQNRSRKQRSSQEGSSAGKRKNRK